MSPPTSIQFIDAALSCTNTPSMLSYTDPDQKWIIREQLISLLQDFPFLIPSMDIFSHNDGTEVNLLNAMGDLHVDQYPRVAIPITIWIHEDYPHMPPIVYVSTNSTCPIRRDHPFVDPSTGATTSPYLQTWLHPRCSLSKLVHNLIKLFSHNHPFFHSASFSLVHPSLVSKMEALDRVACNLHYDMVAIRAKTEEEIEELSTLQVKMVERIEVATSMVIGLEHERMTLKRRVTELMEEADMLANWLRDKDKKYSIAGRVDIEDKFEAVDGESKLVLDCLSADKAVDDEMYALDKAVERGVVNFGVYIRQVRLLAREQFNHRAMLVKLKGPNILNWANCLS